MNFWETLLISLIPAIFTAVVAYFIAVKQNKNEISKIEKQVESNLLEYKDKGLLEIKKVAIFNSLSLIDDFISWSTIDDGQQVSERKNITPLELTELGRKCLNELCLTCDNEELINLFLTILFDNNKSSKHVNIFENYAKYRNVARKELGLKEINFDLDKVFIGRLATKNMK